MNLLLLLAYDDSSAVIFTLLLGIAGLIIGIAWIVFPFIVVSKCNEIIKLLSRIDGRPEPPALKQVADEATRARFDLGEIKEPLTSLRESANEISKGLQWMIDNWPSPKP